MSSIGRNEPCPCGSGKKYKKCCLGKIEPRNPFASRSLAEEVALGPLMQSDRFKKFYEIERPKIIKPITWTHDPNLPDGVNYRCTRSHNGEQIIRLKHVPISINEDMEIAHELLHLIVDAEGFPNVGYTDQRFENLGASISSMVHDVLVDARLAAYGLDMAQKYKKEIIDSRRQLNKISNAPTDRLGQLLWIFNYTSKLLDYEVAIKYAGPFEDDFQPWFEEKYPSIAQESHKLVETVNIIGFNTPSKMTALFSSILILFSVNQVLSIASANYNK